MDNRTHNNESYDTGKPVHILRSRPRSHTSKSYNRFDTRAQSIVRYLTLFVVQLQFIVCKAEFRNLAPQSGYFVFFTFKIQLLLKDLLKNLCFKKRIF